jgi:hypothetical protein
MNMEADGTERMFIRLSFRYNKNASNGHILSLLSLLSDFSLHPNRCQSGITK